MVDATVPDVIRFFGTYYVWVLIALNFVTLTSEKVEGRGRVYRIAKPAV